MPYVVCLTVISTASSTTSVTKVLVTLDFTSNGELTLAVSVEMVALNVIQDMSALLARMRR